MKNNKKKFLVLFLLLVVSVSVLTSCGKKDEVVEQVEQKEEVEQKEVTIVDALDREITVSLPIEKAVVLNRNTLELIKLIDSYETIVGFGDKANELNPYLGFEGKEYVGANKDLNIEAIIGLSPDVVFAHPNRNLELEEMLDPLGIKVIRLSNYLPHTLDEEALIVGQLFQKEDRVEEYLNWKKDIQTLVEDRTKDLKDEDKKTVLALNSGAPKDEFSIYPSKSLGGEAGVGEGMASILAGGIDPSEVEWDPTVASTTIKVDPEMVLEINPDIITLNNSWYGGYEAKDTEEFDAIKHTLLNETNTFKKLKAAENKDVYMFQTNFLGSDKGYIGVLQLSKYMYPELYEDIEPLDYAKEYFEKWLGIDFDGIWWYSLKDN